MTRNALLYARFHYNEGNCKEFGKKSLSTTSTKCRLIYFNSAFSPLLFYLIFSLCENADFKRQVCMQNTTCVIIRKGSPVLLFIQRLKENGWFSQNLWHDWSIFFNCSVYIRIVFAFIRKMRSSDNQVFYEFLSSKVTLPRLFL